MQFVGFFLSKGGFSKTCLRYTLVVIYPIILENFHLKSMTITCNWSAVKIKMWPKLKMKNLSCYEIPRLCSSIYSVINLDTMIFVAHLINVSLYHYFSSLVLCVYFTWLWCILFYDNYLTSNICKS